MIEKLSDELLNAVRTHGVSGGQLYLDIALRNGDGRKNGRELDHDLELLCIGLHNRRQEARQQKLDDLYGQLHSYQEKGAFGLSEHQLTRANGVLDPCFDTAFSLVLDVYNQVHYD